jgi:hypothetical protein
MTDDPHDATWIPPTKKIVWCAVCKEDMESCDCQRGPTGAAIVLTLMGVFATLIVVAIARLHLL